MMRWDGMGVFAIRSCNFKSPEVTRKFRVSWLAKNITELHAQIRLRFYVCVRGEAAEDYIFRDSIPQIFVKGLSI